MLNRVRRIEDRLIGEFDPMRRGVLEASRTCIERWGLVKTRLSDIAAEAGVSRANIYNYFDEGKDGILRVLSTVKATAYDEYFADTLELAGPAADIIVSRLLGGIEAARYDPFSQELLANSERFREFTQYAGLRAAQEGFWRRALDYAALRGELAPGLTPEEAHRWIFFIMIAILENIEQFPSRESLRNDLDRFLVPAVCPRSLHTDPQRGS